MLACAVPVLMAETMTTAPRLHPSDWWSGAYLKGLTTPRDLRRSIIKRRSVIPVNVVHIIVSRPAF
jgi:hypothetical protein